jgi:hypothetical protein
MTEADLKQLISNGFVSILANFGGYDIDKPQRDSGVDWRVNQLQSYKSSDGYERVISSSNYLDIQLKATTESSIFQTRGGFKYDLESKNFNDLVTRRKRGITPMILVLLILPSNKVDWVNIDKDMLTVRKNAFWYHPPLNSPLQKRYSTKRIFIHKKNMLGIDCFDVLFSNLNWG